MIIFVAKRTLISIGGVEKIVSTTLNSVPCNFCLRSTLSVEIDWNDTCEVFLVVLHG
jgi:hypothetical protein